MSLIETFWSKLLLIKLTKIVILTGNEIRHKYFRTYISNNKNFECLATICESNHGSLKNRLKKNTNVSNIEWQHVLMRQRSEIKYFSKYIRSNKDLSNPYFIKKGDINNQDIVDLIIKLKPDIIICYGSSIIKSNLIDLFKRRFINVHLGLSPYYLGAGTNIWPIINNELDKIGATFMYIDKGIDTGQVIHQIRADILKNDDPHQIGNRLIKKMAVGMVDIINNFDNLAIEKPLDFKGKTYLHSDFNKRMCELLYKNVKDGHINKYVESVDYNKIDKCPIIENKALEQSL
tara:strand:- start:42729 stop:43598 length:870 start_codon:yes stop_codon:yes gene_type:complete